VARILLMRHAEVADPGVFHGAESDIALGAKGHAQARALAAALVDERPELVISSAMRRARETATPIARACGVEHRIEPELHERRVGALRGRPHQDHDGPWPETLRRWMAGDTSYAPQGSESFEDIRDRVRPVWDRVCADLGDRGAAIVAHGVVIRVLLMSVNLGFGPADWHALSSRNAGIYELAGRPGRWEVLRRDAIPEGVAAVGDGVG
jgi:probable phosphoglycerate mutase